MIGGMVEQIRNVHEGSCFINCLLHSLLVHSFIFRTKGNILKDGRGKQLVFGVIKNKAYMFSNGFRRTLVDLLVVNRNRLFYAMKKYIIMQAFVHNPASGACRFFRKKNVFSFDGKGRALIDSFPL